MSVRRLSTDKIKATAVKAHLMKEPHDLRRGIRVSTVVDARKTTGIYLRYAVVRYIPTTVGA